MVSTQYFIADTFVVSKDTLVSRSELSYCQITLNRDQVPI